MSNPFGGPLFPSLFPPLFPSAPRVDIDEYLKNKDYEGGLHKTQREMWEANAGIEERNGKIACQRNLDVPEGK